MQDTRAADRNSAEPVPDLPAAEPAALLELVELSRAFGETRALSAASLLVKPGEVHALAGENGSGKSTLIKILSGALRPDAGHVRWNGADVRLGSPRAAQRTGISTVFQETLVVPELSVRDNIFVGTDGMVRRHSSDRAEHDWGRALLDDLGLRELDLSRLVWTLSLAEQQLVTIARALVRPWRLLVLDEGTSALDAQQRDRLFGLLRDYRAEGRSILFTSHRMDEVQQLADTVSVLRLGSTVARFSVADTSPHEILSLMAGAASADLAAGTPITRSSRRAAAEASPVLRAEQVRLQPDAEPFDLVLGRGDILGLAGLEGQGQERFADALCGLYAPPGGRVRVADGTDGWSTVRSYSQANANGIAYVPRDRKREGLFFALSILDNFAMASMRAYNVGGVLRRRALRARFREYETRLRMKIGAPADLIGTLSGGNQQKVLLARWLATDPNVLVLNDPFRGVDANTKGELYALLRQLSDGGLTIVLLSTEVTELLLVCDRIAVFHDASLRGQVPVYGSSEADVVALMFGHSEGIDVQK